MNWTRIFKKYRVNFLYDKKKIDRHYIDEFYFESKHASRYSNAWFYMFVLKFRECSRHI